MTRVGRRSLTTAGRWLPPIAGLSLLEGMLLGAALGEVAKDLLHRIIGPADLLAHVHLRRDAGAPDPHVVWGITERILRQFLGLVG